jgi:hypothetical protein
VTAINGEIVIHFQMELDEYAVPGIARAKIVYVADPCTGERSRPDPVPHLL